RQSSTLSGRKFRIHSCPASSAAASCHRMQTPCAAGSPRINRGAPGSGRWAREDEARGRAGGTRNSRRFRSTSAPGGPPPVERSLCFIPEAETHIETPSQEQPLSGIFLDPKKRSGRRFVRIWRPDNAGRGARVGPLGSPPTLNTEQPNTDALLAFSTTNTSPAAALPPRESRGGAQRYRSRR